MQLVDSGTLQPTYVVSIHRVILVQRKAPAEGNIKPLLRLPVAEVRSTPNSNLNPTSLSRLYIEAIVNRLARSQAAVATKPGITSSTSSCYGG